MSGLRLRASWLLQQGRPERRQAQLREQQQRRRPVQRRERQQVRLQQRVREQQPERVQVPGLLLSCHRRPG